MGIVINYYKKQYDTVKKDFQAIRSATDNFKIHFPIHCHVESEATKSRYLFELRHIANIDKILLPDDLSKINSATLIDLFSKTNRHTAIKESVLGEVLAGKLYAIYNPEFYLYSLEESSADYYLIKVGADISKFEGRLEKIEALRLLQKCARLILHFSEYEYFRLLQYAFGSPTDHTLLKQ